MLYDYQRAEITEQVMRAEHRLKGSCPLISDEVTVAEYNHITELEAFVRDIAFGVLSVKHSVNKARELLSRCCVPFDEESE